MSAHTDPDPTNTTDVAVRGNGRRTDTVEHPPALGPGADDVPPPTVDEPVDADERSGSGRRRTLLVVAGVVLAGAAAAAVLATRDGGDDDVATETVQLTGVTAEQRDLVEFSEVDGSVRYADGRSVQAGADGTVTAIAEDGTVVEAGDVVVEVDGEPLVVLVGDELVLRTLEEGTSGDDVLMLERNLATLEFTEDLEDAEGEPLTLTVDGDFDAATRAAVLAFQADVGLREDGSLSPQEVVAVEGPSVVTGVQVGVADRVQPGAPIAELALLRSTNTAHTATTGDLEVVATAGEPVTGGDVLYTVDDRAVVAIVTDTAYDRTLQEGDTGDDVLALEETLVALGHDADGDLEVDDEFDADTREAVEDWESDLADEYDGTGVDGVVQLSDVVVVPTGDGVVELLAEEGDDVVAGQAVMVVGDLSERRVVDTTIDPADQSALPEGGTVEVELPDGSVVDAVVTEVATTTTTDPTDPDADPTLDVQLELPALPESVAELTTFDVTVRVADEVATGVVAVPVSALVFTGDAYAVEVPAQGGGTTFVAVEPGLFADGFVEVTGIEAGTTVVVPS